jgi:hypothetical protein
MDNEYQPDLPVRCPECSAFNQVCITHQPHKAVNCGSCSASFIIDQTLICQFYASDDDAHWILEDFYRAPLVQFFWNRGMSQIEAEKCHADVFTKVRETKYPRPGNDPRRYDPNLPDAGSFRTWVLRIARRCFEDRRGRQQVLFSEIQAGRSGDEGAAFDPAAFQRDLNLNPISQPEAEAIARQHRKAVHDCHETLQPREKMAITIWLEHEGSHGIGNILAGELKAHFPERGCSAATASNLLAKAMGLMKDCLEEKGVDVSWSW